MPVVNNLCPASHRQWLVFHNIWMVIYIIIFMSGQGGALSQIATGLAQNHATNNSAPVDTPHPMQIKMQTERPIILLDLNSKKTITMNFTLQCDHPSSVYVVSAKSVTEDVATVIGGNPVKISCKFGVIAHDLNSKKSQNNASNSESVLKGQNDNNIMGVGEGPINNENNVDVDDEGIQMNSNEKDSAKHEPFEISGEFEMLFKSHRIGRSFFLMFAMKVSGPGTHGKPAIAAANKTNNEMASTSGLMGMRNQNINHGAAIQIQRKTGNDSSPNKGGNYGVSPGRPAAAGRGGGHPRPKPIVKSMILVMKLPGPVDKIFRIVLYVVIITATIGMGIKVELDVVVKVMKKPLGPCIGLFCQYVCMPLIAYVIAQTIPQPSAAISLGIFTCGIVPGGGASNFWCYLLGGDVTLSVTMTTISSIVALGFIPMWLFTLGQNFKDDTAEIHVPYPKILETLAIVLLPVFAGILLKRKLPRVAKFVSKILKPFLIIIVLFLLGVGIYANFFIFAMIRPMQILAGCLLPYVGYVIGGGIALLTRRPWVHVKTIAIETGIQNTGIAFMIVFFSFPPPDNQLAVVAPAASAIMTPLPLIVVTFFYTIYTRHQNKKKANAQALVDEADEGLQHKKAKDLNENTNASSVQVNKAKESGLYDEDAPRRKTKRTLWEKITGKQPDDETPDMEEMLNKEISVKSEVKG